MVKVLVLYDSWSGNTEKMALAVVDGVKQVDGVEAVSKKVDDASVDDLEKADGIIIGSPTFYGLMSGKLKLLIDKSVKIHGKLEGKSEAPSRPPAKPRRGPRRRCFQSWRRCRYTAWSFKAGTTTNIMAPQP